VPVTPNTLWFSLFFSIVKKEDKLGFCGFFSWVILTLGFSGFAALINKKGCAFFRISTSSHVLRKA
jgi:hypothetical protein